MAGTRSPFDLTLARKVPGDMPSLVNPPPVLERAAQGVFYDGGVVLVIETVEAFRCKHSRKKTRR